MSVVPAVLKRITDATHLRRPERVPIWEARDEAVAAGIEGIDPVDPSAGMDIGAIRRKCSRRLILVGHVGRNHVLRWVTADQVGQEVRDCLVAVGPGGGHVLQSDDGQRSPSVPARQDWVLLTFASQM